jgi:predicted dehydrogenase
MFKIGIVGAGRLSRVHIRHLSRLQDISFVVMDRHFERAQELATECGGLAVASFDQLLENSDAIDVITPNDTHAEFAVKAIEAGKHTFIEKPLEISTAAARPILDAASNSQATVTVGHVVRYFAMYKRAHDTVKSGSIGTPAAIRMTRGGGMPGGEGGWFGDHKRSGGVFIDLAVHDFDWLLWTIGNVKEVYAKSVGAKTDFGPDYGLATLTFENGCVAHVESTWMDPSESRTAFEVCGSDGMLEYDSRNNATIRSGNKLEQNHLPDDDPFYQQLRDFVSCAREGKPAPITVQDAFNALAIGEACLQSAKSGMPVFL